MESFPLEHFKNSKNDNDLASSTTVPYPKVLLLTEPQDKLGRSTCSQTRSMTILDYLKSMDDLNYWMWLVRQRFDVDVSCCVLTLMKCDRMLDVHVRKLLHRRIDLHTMGQPSGHVFLLSPSSSIELDYDKPHPLDRFVLTAIKQEWTHLIVIYFFK